MDRISTFGNTNSLIQQTMQVQATYAAKQAQTASGLKSESYSGIASDSQQLLSLESMYSRITGQVAAGNAAENRMNSMSSTLGSISSLITSSMSTLSAAMSGTGTSGSTATSADLQQDLSELVSLLNSSYGGQYLFGGAVTDTAPVNTSASGYNPLGGSADTTYYQGDSNTTSVAVSDTLTVNYGITADNPAFEQALRALAVAVANPTDTTQLQSAYDLLSSASDGVSSISSDLGNKIKTVDNQVTLQSTTLTHLDSTISDLRNVDVASVSVQLSEIETQLEAAYGSLTKLLSLNLTDYLR